MFFLVTLKGGAPEENQVGYGSEEEREEEGKEEKEERKSYAFPHKNCNVCSFNFGDKDGGSSHTS